MTNYLKQIMPRFLIYFLQKIILFFRLFLYKANPFFCPICKQNVKGYLVGFFPKLDTACPKCFSLSRHRIFTIWFEGINKRYKKILHFAPEKPLINTIKKFDPEIYVYGDLNPKSADEKQLDINKINFPAKHFDLIIAFHIIEHVNDKLALKEMHKVLKDDGSLALMFPIVDSWEKTYENLDVITDKERSLHFGQFDHLRYYGKDVEKLFEENGFKLNKIIPSPKECVKHGLDYGETLFILSKN